MKTSACRLVMSEIQTDVNVCLSSPGQDKCASGTVSIEEHIVSILSAKPVSGLKVRQIRVRLQDLDVDTTSMQLSKIVQQMNAEGTIIRHPSPRGKNYRYSLNE